MTEVLNVNFPEQFVPADLEEYQDALHAQISLMRTGVCLVGRDPSELMKSDDRLIEKAHYVDILGRSVAAKYGKDALRASLA